MKRETCFNRSLLFGITLISKDQLGSDPNPKVFAASAAVRNVLATTFTKEAITRISTRSAKIMKSFLAFEPIEDLMI